MTKAAVAADKRRRLQALNDEIRDATQAFELRLAYDRSGSDLEIVRIEAATKRIREIFAEKTE